MTRTGLLFAPDVALTLNLLSTVVHAATHTDIPRFHHRAMELRAVFYLWPP